MPFAVSPQAAFPLHQVNSVKTSEQKLLFSATEEVYEIDHGYDHDYNSRFGKHEYLLKYYEYDVPELMDNLSTRLLKVDY